MTSPDLREHILNNYFKYHGKPLSNGDFSDNKLDLESLEHSHMAGVAINGLAERVKPHQPDLVIGIPEGANWLGKALAWRLGAGTLRLDKDEQGRIDYFPGGLEVVEAANAIAIADDVRRTDSNLRKVLALEAMADTTVVSVAIWDRNPELPGVEGIEQQAVIEEYIPLEIASDHPLAGYLR